ncbi:MAG: hypothetical protein N2491_13035 [Negativicutes bacterium]|nr:hypothetical protein [Negativicutes bacterium]
MRKMFAMLLVVLLLLPTTAGMAGESDNFWQLASASADQSGAGIAVEFIAGGPVTPPDRQYEFGAWKVTVRNSGSKPVDHIQFRLNIYYQDDNSLLYSQVHTVNLHLDPQDVLMSTPFPLKQKIAVGILRISWNAELIRAW